MFFTDEKQCMLDFAKRLNGLRQEKGPSARDMSLTLGFAPNYISNLESAKNYPTMQAFFYICEYFDITPSEFFDYGNKNPGITNSLYAQLKKLNIKTAKCFAELIEEFNKN